LSYDKPINLPYDHILVNPAIKNFLKLYFNTFLTKKRAKTGQKLLKIHSKPSILTLFNKFSTGFERFKKY